MSRDFEDCPHCYSKGGHSVFKCGKCSREWCSECNVNGAFGGCPACDNDDTDHIDHIGHVTEFD